VIKLNGRSLTIEQLVQIARTHERVTLATETLHVIQRSRALVEKKLAAQEIIYGVDTGFGELSTVSIPAEKAQSLQLNLIRSHAVGVGSLMPEAVVRAMMVLRVNSLAQGYSGVRRKVLTTLINFLNHNILPLVHAKGSLGASGDLVPLAHMALALVGEGQVTYQGKIKSARIVLKKLNIKPLVLEVKEGLALINGTQFMTAIGSLAVYDAYNLAQHADYAAALSGDVLKSSINHTDPLVHKLRPHPGQKTSAILIRRLMKNSEIWASHQSCEKVQDAYSIRCAPQVHGATRDVIDYVWAVLEIEMNSVTDNPLIFPQQNKILSAGNFHGQPIALSLDFLKIAVSELANISERRISRLVDHKLSECLPPFLTVESGLHSGFMVMQYTAAALVSENKVLSHPASVDSIPTSAGQEDHVSMGAISALHLQTVIENTEHVLAIELLSGAQALDLHRPLKSSPELENLYAAIRTKVPVLRQDRVMNKDIVKVITLMQSQKLINS